MKRCPKCGKAKPLDAFNPDKSRPDGRRARCRACLQVIARERRRAHPERRPRRQLRATNPAKYREAKNAENKRRRDRQRAQVFDHYGRACACCNATDNLTIDHINGDGDGHRRELFGDARNTGRIYAWLIREGFPADFQTLCRKCNTSKGGTDQCHLSHLNRTFGA